MMPLILPSCYLGPVSWYSALFHAQETRIEVFDHYTKQTLRNRCLIDSPSGAQALSIPVVKPDGKALMKDIRISDHGNWRHQHWNALRSSYRQSPFFEYYADDFAPFYERKWAFLCDFNDDLLRLVCTLLDIQPNWKRTESFQLHNFLNTQDNPLPPAGGQRELYYQVFASRHGFLPDLSIADLLFNMGPESVLYL